MVIICSKSMDQPGRVANPARGSYAVTRYFLKCYLKFGDFFSTICDRLWVPESGSFLHGIISGLLPVVALAVLTSLVPLVIRFTAMK